MIRIEQIRELESKIHAAVERIRTLTAENDKLKENLIGYEGRVTELQREVEAFKSEQDAIESGIVSALRHLDQLEDGVGEAKQESAPAPKKRTPRSAGQKPSPENQSPPEQPQQERKPEPEEPEVLIGDAEEEPELDIF
jgi:chromosome segregation ATPase